MPKIRIFNPEHDLALAFGGTNYTAPPMARLLRRDLQMLPAWFSSGDEYILSQNKDSDNRWLEKINLRYGMNVKAIDIGDIAQFDEIIPWGWNRFLWHRLQLDGAKEVALPSETDIDNIRTLSHRRISIKIHKMFRDMIPSLRDITPCEYDNINDVIDFARRYPCAYTKAPWSSSGKGIYRALDIDGLDFTRWCSGIIKRQGSIMCEQPLDSVMDFAMEFQCSEGRTSFIGYSVFNNDTHSSFCGGMLGTTALLHTLIATALGNDSLLSLVQECAIKILDTLIAPYYTGYAGLDMMIYSDKDGSLQINPCIELNLRTTMGVVSSIIGNRFLAEGSSGTFHVEFHKTTVTEDYIHQMEDANPLQLTPDGKIIHGTQFLTPIYPDSQYTAHITVKDPIK